MEKSKSTHDCYRHLDSKCRCTVCGKTHHVIASDSNYSGLGRVNVACLRCGSSEAFEDSTGATFYSDFDGKDYSDYYGCRVDKEEIAKGLRLTGHSCEKYLDILTGKCLVCGKKIKEPLK
ncbi:MAG: hypothetical protein QM204_03075 [Bacillota bacterium]|jgi:hypothetical protein|nr:hypothetical protein [Bacillota bacterium]NLL27055.1 hypothetical protein [Erysipelotrichia bacterium]